MAHVIPIRGSAGRGPETGSTLTFSTVHGYRRAYRIAGEGPAVLLIHGVGASSAHWEDCFAALARRHTVIAPDLLGHGDSAKPRADYSVAAYANGLRDLLGVLGVERVTLVGHSFGGGVAMQFAYQFPERVDRLVLISTGGVGRQVTPVLRAATLPGAGLALGLLKVPGAQLSIAAFVRALQLLDTGLGVDAVDLVNLVDALPDQNSRNAFTRTLRAVVDWRGQVVTMLDRCYLAQGIPTLLVWGDRDSVLPVDHAHTAHLAMPGSRLEIFPGAGHFPHHADPARFVRLLQEFIATTTPGDWSIEQWRELLRTGRPEDIYTRGVERQYREASERSAT
ncbi:alpha/beta hydrolase [Streptomyces sp. NBC_00006]|uniref:alpha/beta fold hydrolase n=1 Tax=unclassified Streptomyces TaxID=2593676 RepID=UPI00224EFBD5|nr:MULTISPECIES: alpha/beta hydrolase [unclassified Streptomyces]MCX4834803.1 alpha/beta hydrolase [Streptomyces sp. NBC_01016]MCX5529318.1 alpha/beta hydrolase [Streptomyces sp. NBC_00006]